MARLNAIVVTGLSGSGKSTALRVLEDLGYYCIDNLPVALLPRFVELWDGSRDEVRRVALGIDVRERHFLRDVPRVFDELRRAGVALEVVWFEASDEVLVRRFSETRRPHPAAEGGTVGDGIRNEREAMHLLREQATRIIDTSTLNVHELRTALREQLGPEEGPDLSVSLVSFGYKHGLPADTDLALDVRFLPNPFFVEALRPRTGLDADVAGYVLERPETQEFLTRLMGLLEFCLPHYQREGKSYLTIAIGCTGGRHRSVAVVEELRRRLEALGRRVRVRHRDAER